MNVRKEFANAQLPADVNNKCEFIIRVAQIATAEESHKLLII